MRIVILYGSQTGTAQDVAEQIWSESCRYGCTGPVLPLDSFPVEKLQSETVIIFVVATTGQGDVPNNMCQTWRYLLRRNLPNTLLQHLQFACLGLGDSGYTQFNYAAKRLHKRLQQLGANALQPLGLCDDQHDHGLSAVSLPWIASLFELFSHRFSIKKQILRQHIDKWHVKTLPTILERATNLQELQWPDVQNLRQFTLLDNKRTTSEEHFQEVLLLSFVMPTNISWQPGNVLEVRPSNSAEKVSEFFTLMAEHNLPFSENTLLQFSKAHAEIPLPTAYEKPVTLKELVEHVWDLSAQPRQRAFELLSINCTDELELEKLCELATGIGLEDYINYVQRPRRSILEVLQDFRHATAKLTLPILCELFAHIQPRSYSIASAACTNVLELLVAVVNYKTKLSTPRLGVCTNWLKSLKSGDCIWGLIKGSVLQLPLDNSTPLIMVGPGTGIAPIRSIIQHRLHEQATGRMLVFFGCRYKQKDYHFRENFEYWQNKELLDVFLAFSRDQADKIYVQHLIKAEANRLKDLILQQEAIILVAGSSKNMPKAVKEAFTDIVEGNEQYIEKLIKTKRYQEETWS